MKINGKEITAKAFAFDGCHKIYLVETVEDDETLREYGYDIYEISGIKQAYEDSCSLRFIQTFGGDDEKYEDIVPQGVDVGKVRFTGVKDA